MRRKKSLIVRKLTENVRVDMYINNVMAIYYHSIFLKCIRKSSFGLYISFYFIHRAWVVNKYFAHVT